MGWRHFLIPLLAGLALWWMAAGTARAQNGNGNDGDVAAYLARGQALAKAGKPDQALPYFLLALELSEARHGDDDPAVLPVLIALADLYAVQDQYRDAEPLYERALTIQEREATRFQAGAARTLIQLAAIYEATGRPQEARRSYERVLTMAAPVLGDDHASIVAARDGLARLVRVAGGPPPAQAPPPRRVEKPAPEKTPEVPAPTPEPKPVPAAAPKKPVPGAYQIHLTSIRNPADAEAEWARLKRLYGSLLADLSLVVARVDLGPRRGVWYRIKGGPLAPEEARGRCAAFAARGVWCRVAGPPRPLDLKEARRVRKAVPKVREAAVSGPGFRIHLTSIRNPADAEAEWRRLKRLYGRLLDGLELAVERADLG
ncbi:MAG: hypothetical protein D6826_11255, partial [Alphaproteobacteria bacterium]